MFFISSYWTCIHTPSTSFHYILKTESGKIIIAIMFSYLLTKKFKKICTFFSCCLRIGNVYWFALKWQFKLEKYFLTSHFVRIKLKVCMFKDFLEMFIFQISENYTQQSSKQIHKRYTFCGKIYADVRTAHVDFLCLYLPIFLFTYLLALSMLEFVYLKIIEC